MTDPAPQNRPMALAGLKVLELGQLIAGPFASKLFGEFGADVIKIEPPGTGDPLRRWRVMRGDTSCHARPSPANGASSGHRPPAPVSPTRAEVGAVVRTWP